MSDDSVTPNVQVIGEIKYITIMSIQIKDTVTGHWSRLPSYAPHLTMTALFASRRFDDFCICWGASVAYQFKP
jgi:hypothetical protein